MFNIPVTHFNLLNTGNGIVHCIVDKLGCLLVQQIFCLQIQSFVFAQPTSHFSVYAVLLAVWLFCYINIHRLTEVDFDRSSKAISLLLFVYFDVWLL